MFESNYEVEIVKYGYRVLFTQAEHLVQGLGMIRKYEGFLRSVFCLVYNVII